MNAFYILRCEYEGPPLTVPFSAVNRGAEDDPENAPDLILSAGILIAPKHKPHI